MKTKTKMLLGLGLGSASLLLMVGAAAAGVFNVAMDRTVSTADERTIVGGAGPILSIDLDGDILYYLQQRVEGNVVIRHRLSTAEETTLYTTSPNSIGWLAVSRSGTLFVLDVGDNAFDLPWKETKRPRRIVELRGTEQVGSIRILSPSELFARSGQPTQTKQAIAAGCTAALAAAGRSAPLGLERAWSHAKGEKGLVPRYLVLGDNVAVAGVDCGLEPLRPYATRAVTENLCRLDERRIRETLSAQDALLVDEAAVFAYRSVSKGFGYHNLPCEKYQDQISWGRSTFNMGSCAGGIMGFAQSFNSFTASGDFVYYRYNGVLSVRRPAR